MSNVSRRGLLKLTSILAVLRPDVEVEGLPQDSHLVGGAPVAFETRTVISLAGSGGPAQAKGICSCGLVKLPA